MDTIVQWATILSPIIAVVIAVWVSKKSEKDTNKQVEAMKKQMEEMRKQVIAIKRLSLLQMESHIDMLEMELYKYSLGKENDNMELRALSKEMHLMQQEQDFDSEKMSKMQQKMESLGKNVQYKGNFELKIIMRQFAIMREMENVKKA